MIRKAWGFLLSPENRTVLAWLGGGALAAAVAVLGALLQAPQRPSTATSGPAAAQPGISAPGGVAAGTISGGSFTIGPQSPSPAPPKPDAPR
jgi:hypothetical protein